MPSCSELWPSITEAKGPVPGHVSKGAATLTAAGLLRATGITCLKKDLEVLWWAQVLIRNPHRLQRGTGLVLTYLENRTAYCFLVSRIKRCHLVKSLGRETIFKLGQFIKNTAQQHLQGAHPLKRENHSIC